MSSVDFMHLAMETRLFLLFSSGFRECPRLEKRGVQHIGRTETGVRRMANGYNNCSSILNSVINYRTGSTGEISQPQSFLLTVPLLT